MAGSKFNSARGPDALDILVAMRESYAAFAADRTRNQSLRVMATGVMQDLDAAIALMATSMFVADRRRA